MTDLIKVELIRLSKNKLGPQLGTIRINGIPRFASLELPDLDNKPKESCIPEGIYTAKATKSRKIGGYTLTKTYEVMNVPGRSGILFHYGNTVNDTEGCILIGQRFGVIKEEIGILSSRLGFDEFLKILTGQLVFELIISRV